MLIWLVSIPAQLLNRENWMVWPGPRGKQMQKGFRHSTSDTAACMHDDTCQHRKSQNLDAKVDKGKVPEPTKALSKSNRFSLIYIHNSSRSGASHSHIRFVFISPASLTPFGTLRCANPGSPGHTSTDHGGSRGPFFQVSAQHVRFAASKRRGKRKS